MQQFNDTYKYMCNVTGYNGSDMPFITWNTKPKDLKTAFLYVNFFESISSAWYKASWSYIDECTAVSTVLQYLTKNSVKIENDPKRYTASYIYTVCFNCIRDLRWYKRDMDRNKYETDSVFTSNGEEFDIFSLLSDDTYNKLQNNTDTVYEEELFTLIESKGKEYDKVAHYLICPDIPLRKTSRSNTRNPFNDLTVSKSDIPRIKGELSLIVAKYLMENKPDLFDEMREDISRVVSTYVSEYRPDMLELIK